MRLRKLVTAVAAAAFGGALAAAPAQADELEYVAMGDSFAAGPLIPAQNSLLCLRSDSNYPSVAAKALGARLKDVSCSGATLLTMNLQYGALSASTDLVSVTIGGNDTGLVTKALTCFNPFQPPADGGGGCSAVYAPGGKDSFDATVAGWAPKFGKALDEIRKRAPKAKVMVVGYGHYVRDEGCWPTQPIWPKDAAYIQGAVDKLSAAMKKEGQARGATFVDTASIGAGHDTCAKPEERYIEGLVPASPAAPLHPNARGMAAYGAEVARHAG